MKNSAPKKIYFFLLLISTDSIVSYSIKNCIINGSKLMLCAGPTWLEAFYYYTLLHENKPVAYTTTPNSRYIQDILQKHNLLQNSTISIETLRPQDYDFVHSALTCTPSAILINTPLFNKLSDTEKEAIIVHTALRIEKKQLRTHALVLSCLPILSEFILKLCAYSTDRITHTRIREALLNTGSYCPPTWIIKLLLNTTLGHYYLRHQAKRADLAAVQKLKNSSALASFYTKMHTLIKQKSILLSLRQPSLETRIQYLSS